MRTRLVLSIGLVAAAVSLVPTNATAQFSLFGGGMGCLNHELVPESLTEPTIDDREARQRVEAKGNRCTDETTAPAQSPTGSVLTFGGGSSGGDDGGGISGGAY